MTRKTIVALSLPIVLSLVIGCGPDNRKPANAAEFKPAETKPLGPAATADEKIERIKAAPLSDKEKEDAIARVRAGKL